MTTQTDKDIHGGHLLAADETILWQGSPGWVRLSLRLFQVPLVAAYFVILAILAVVQKPSLLSALPPLFAAVVFCGLLCGVARVIARSTTYLVTDRRVILRYGVGLPRSLSLPFRQIASMAVFVRPDRRGDIALALKPGNRVAYLKLWPHARGWVFTQPQPMLRNIAAAGAVATLLARELQLAEQQRGAVEQGALAIETPHRISSAPAEALRRAS